MNAPLLKVGALSKSYGARPVLQGINLVLAAGQAYVLTGDNGAGKSTLLRIIAGLEHADAGILEFCGKLVPPIRYPDWMRRDVVYVHQHPYLFHTSVAANIAFGLKTRGISRAVRQAIVRDAMAWAGVTHLAAVPPQKLSGGETQRIALARAKVLNPALYLLDEPTASLDGDARRQTIELITQLCQTNNSVLIACHDRELINLPHVLRFDLRAGQVTRHHNGALVDA